MINPNKPMEFSNNHGANVPNIYTYVPNSNILKIEAHFGTAQLGRHVNSDNVVSIQYFEYQGPVITDGKDENRYVPRNKGR